MPNPSLSVSQAMSVGGPCLPVKVERRRAARPCSGGTEGGGQWAAGTFSSLGRHSHTGWNGLRQTITSLHAELEIPSFLNRQYGM